MLRILWLPLMLLPLAEIAVFVLVAAAIGFFGALAACILMAVLGTWLIQGQGFDNFLKAQESLRAGRMPFHDIFNGMCVVVAGLLFILPGFLSDALGIVLLIPQMRNLAREFLSPRLKEGPPPEGVIIEGEYERVEEERERLQR